MRLRKCFQKIIIMMKIMAIYCLRAIWVTLKKLFYLLLLEIWAKIEFHNRFKMMLYFSIRWKIWVNIDFETKDYGSKNASLSVSLINCVQNEYGKFVR